MNMEKASSSAEVKSQYHHFIPRFILRNFSHKQHISKRSKKSGKGKKKAATYRPPEAMVYGIDLSGPEAAIVETPVAKTFGMVDMYRDGTVENSAMQHHIEEQLSVLESQAAAIISSIRKDFEAGKKDVWVTRGQRDKLRKFLFIMKYRGSTFHKRFYHEDPAAYDSDDKATLAKYMAEKGFKKPIDVWFDNIKGMLELKMDSDLAWMEKLKERIYPDDAAWFNNNIQQFFLAICTPAESEDAFLLTQNAYSMHEGPNSLRYNPITKELTPGVYTEFHLFAPISPRLIFVLRSFMLPDVLADANPDAKRLREAWFEASKIQHDSFYEFGSILEDLPISKARNSYSKVIDGNLVAVDGWKKGPSDKFCFSFTPIKTAHVSTINNLMLEECYKMNSIVFSTKASALKTLELYLKDHDEFDRHDPVGDPRRTEYTRKLHSAVELLGGTSNGPSRPRSPIMATSPFQSLAPDEVFNLFKRNENITALYKELSGKLSLDQKDFSQARNLLYMRIKLDSNSQGQAEEKREEARNRFLNAYKDFPIQVIWIYLKRTRLMRLGGSMIGPFDALWDSKLPVDEIEGNEDTIARARNLFRERDLAKIMHYACCNAISMRKASFGLVGELTLDDDGQHRLRQEKYIVLGSQGSICECGIPDLEKEAKRVRQDVRDRRLHDLTKSPFDSIFTVDERIELKTRALLDRDFALDGGGLSLHDQRALKRVIFDTVFPVFGSRQGMQFSDKHEDVEPEGCSIQ